MPQEFKKYDSEMQDGRRKLPESKHEEVRRKYKELKSQRETARYFGVSRRLIVFILYPNRMKKLQEDAKRTHKWMKYYDKDKRRVYMAKCRAKKKKLGYVVVKQKAAR